MKIKTWIYEHKYVNKLAGTRRFTPVTLCCWNFRLYFIFHLFGQRHKYTNIYTCTLATFCVSTSPSIGPSIGPRIGPCIGPCIGPAGVRRRRRRRSAKLCSCRNPAPRRPTGPPVKVWPVQATPAARRASHLHFSSCAGPGPRVGPNAHQGTEGRKAVFMPSLHQAVIRPADAGVCRAARVKGLLGSSPVCLLDCAVTNPC